MKKVNAIKKWLIAIGIAIIFAMFVNYGVSTFYQEPDFNDYKPEDCPEQQERRVVKELDDYRIECDEWGNKGFKEIKDRYDTNAFIILVVLGLIGLILGVTLKVEAVSTGLLLGGLFTLFFTTVAYWGRLFDYARFIILGVVLIILIWIAYKKLK